MPFDFSQGLTGAEPAAEVSTLTDVNNAQLSLTDTDVAGTTPTPAAPANDNQQNQQPPNNANEQAQNTTAENQDLLFANLLDEMSGGAIKDKATFTAMLPKLTGYDEIVKERDRLSAEMAKAPTFADDEVRILNDLKAGGASKEQIKIFQKINEYGNIAEMPDRDARIAKMVMIDGVKPSVAEIKVDREFKLGDDDLSEEEKEVLADDLRVAAINDRKELEKFKAQVSTAQQVVPEEQLLRQQAALKTHQAAVTPYVKEIVSTIPHLGQYTLSGKDAKDVVKLELPLDELAREQIRSNVEAYFMDGLTKVTPETTLEALHYARAEYFAKNIEATLQAAYDKGVSLTTEKLTNQYENRSGLKPTGDNPLIGGVSDEAATAQFMNRVANRTVGK